MTASSSRRVAESSRRSVWKKMRGAASVILLLCVTVTLASVAAVADDDLIKFNMYFHDVVGGPSPTAIRVAQAPTTNTSPTSFSAVVATDDPLTTGPAASGATGAKDEVGRAQGTYTFADQGTFGLLMNMNFVFTAGEHKGNSLAIYGWNDVLAQVREMSIVGGTGKFRMARGYVEARTIDSGFKSGETIVEYSVYVKVLPLGA